MSKIIETFAISLLTVALLAGGFLLGSAYNMSEPEQVACQAGFDTGTDCRVALVIHNIVN